jgi:hypothetical protein
LIWWRVLSFIPLAVAAKVRGVERRAMERLRDAGANTPERAILMERTGILADFLHRRLVHAGVLRSAGNDRYYVDESAYRAFLARRRRHAALLTGVIIVALAVLYFRGGL